MLPNMIGWSSLLILFGSFLYNKTDLSNLAVFFLWSSDFVWNNKVPRIQFEYHACGEPMLHSLADYFRERDPYTKYEGQIFYFWRYLDSFIILATLHICDKMWFTSSLESSKYIPPNNLLLGDSSYILLRSIKRVTMGLVLVNLS